MNVCKHIFSVLFFKTAIYYKLILFYAVYGRFKGKKMFPINLETMM